MRIAFVGSGNIARQHARGLAQRHDVAFAGAFDANVAQAEEFVGLYGGSAFVDLEEMLDTAKPDAVWVCLPPFAHGEAELALLERRIPFLVEKPVSLSLDTARRVLDGVERSGTLVAVGYMNRYRRGINRAKELLVQDPPILLHGAWVGGTPGVSWWRVKALSGGQIVEQTTHIFDLARYLVGEPKVVCAQGASGFVHDMPGYDVEDASAVTVHFANGAVGSLLSCCANRSGGGGVHLTVVASHLVALFSGWEHKAIIQKSRLEQEHIEAEPDIFALEDEAFVRAVQEHNASLIRSPYADGLKTLAFCLAADRSLSSGEPIEVSSL